MSLRGVDIASYQKNMDVANVDADFVIIKLTQGTYYVNPDFDRQFKQAVASNKLIGLYHYSSGSKPVSYEVSHLLGAAKQYLGKCIVCLDWETNGSTVRSGYNPIFGSAEEVAYVNEFASRFHDATGIWPFIYMSASVTRQHNWSLVSKNCPLWVAQYKNDTLTGYQDNPWRDNKGTGAWSRPHIHQYSPSGSINGYEQIDTHKLDLDIAYMTREEWTKYAACGSTSIVHEYKDVTPALIRDIIANKYGTGATRKKKLEDLGYDYKEVQATVSVVLDLSKKVQKVKDESGEYWQMVLERVK